MVLEFGKLDDAFSATDTRRMEVADAVSGVVAVGNIKQGRAKFLRIANAEKNTSVSSSWS